MKSKVIKICVTIICGGILNCLQYALKSNYLLDFIEDNLVMLLIALFAINSTTLTLIMTKMKELTDKTEKKDAFSKTETEILFSIKEHFALIVFVVLLLILHSSPIINEYKHITKICNILLISSMIYSLHMLYDVSNSACIILKFNQSFSAKSKSDKQKTPDSIGDR